LYLLLLLLFLLVGGGGGCWGSRSTVLRLRLCTLARRLSSPDGGCAPCGTARSGRGRTLRSGRRGSRGWRGRRNHLARAGDPVLAHVADELLDVGVALEGDPRGSSSVTPMNQEVEATLVINTVLEDLGDDGLAGRRAQELELGLGEVEVLEQGEAVKGGIERVARDEITEGEGTRASGGADHGIRATPRRE
jgi:hypothetical protein